MQLSEVLIPLSALAALVLPGILKADHWPDWLNGIIAAVVVALFAAATVWAGGQFTGNLAVDWAVFAAAYSALLAGPLKPLDSWLQSALNLPFLKPAPVNANPVTSLGTSAVVPTPITLPGANAVPPRASAPPTTPSA